MFLFVSIELHIIIIILWVMLSAVTVIRRLYIVALRFEFGWSSGSFNIVS
jgi:hypothetical protein